MYILKLGDMVLYDNEPELCILFRANAHTVLLPLSHTRENWKKLHMKQFQMHLISSLNLFLVTDNLPYWQILALQTYQCWSVMEYMQFDMKTFLFNFTEDKKQKQILRVI